MAQWEQLQRLDPVYLEKVHKLYSGDEFPMDVRHHLAQWIESQDWDRALSDSDLAIFLFQLLLANLDNQHSRFVQEGAPYLEQRKIRRFKQSFQRYEEQPSYLAKIIKQFLAKEKEILEAAQVTGEVQQLQLEPNESVQAGSIQLKISELSQKVQIIGHTINSLEDQQDEFHFKFKLCQMEENATEADKTKLQNLLNTLDQCRKSLLSAIAELLDLVEEMLTVLVKEEMPAWQKRQQRACIGAPEHTCLNQLENWFTAQAECLFQLREFLKKLDELSEKVTYKPDPFKQQKPVLQKRVEKLLTTLLNSAFVVETQPSMLQTKGPLVLRTTHQFSVTVRLLVKVAELNHIMKVNILIDRGISPGKGYRRFNLFGITSKPLSLGESLSGGLVAHFRHLTLKEKKGGGSRSNKENFLCVTEELHILSFETTFTLHGFSVPLSASSLPVVIISSAGQLSSGWASVLWFNMLSSDPLNTRFFASPPLAPWPQLSQMLHWQFLSATKRGLDADQQEMIAQKLFGTQLSYDTCEISWVAFSKDHLRGCSFSFWTWFDGIHELVKTLLKDIWKDGLIMGFVSKEKTKALLSDKQPGTFLLRFSDSTRDGAITFSWVVYSPNGNHGLTSVQPFTKVQLNRVPLPEILRNYNIFFMEENFFENPLLYLFPNIAKDEAFGKYYTVEVGDKNPYLKYRKTKLVFISANTHDAKSPLSDGTEFDDLGLEVDLDDASLGTLYTEEVNTMLESNLNNHVSMYLDECNSDLAASADSEHFPCAGFFK